MMIKGKIYPLIEETAKHVWTDSAHLTGDRLKHIM